MIRRCIFFQQEKKILACDPEFSATLNSAVKHDKKVEICLYWQQKQNKWAEDIPKAFEKAEDKTYSSHGNQICLEMQIAQKEIEMALQRLAKSFVEKEQPRLVLELVKKSLPQLAISEQEFVAEFAEALAKQQGMNVDNDVYIRRLAHRMYVCMQQGQLHLSGFERFRLADLHRRWQKCIERVVSMAVLRYDWAQQMDAWRYQIDQSKSLCKLVRIRKNRKGQFILEVQGYQGEEPGLPNEQLAEESLLSILLAWAPLQIEILLGGSFQESWVYEIIEQLFGPRVKIRWQQH